MLVTLNEVLRPAKKNHYAVGLFNAVNLELARGIINAAECTRSPVIMGTAEVLLPYGPLEEVSYYLIPMAKKASVPVVVHLDHGLSYDLCIKALDLGFTSVMYDGSTLSTEENIANTKLAVEYAKKTGASVEAEIGSMGAGESGTGHAASIYTDPDEAVKFVAETKVDALACAFGTAHGFYKDAPKLDFERLSKINSLIDVPIVMHGGSGVSEEDYREVIARGVRKVNYYTYMAKAGAEAVSEKKYTQFHDVLLDAEKAMKENVKSAIAVFAK